MKFKVSEHVQTAISQHHSQSTDQVSHGRNQLVLFLEPPVIVLTSQPDWWHHQLDCVSLSCKRFLDNNLHNHGKLFMWPKWYNIIYCLVLLRAVTDSNLNVIPYPLSTGFSIGVWLVGRDASPHWRFSKFKWGGY